MTSLKHWELFIHETHVIIDGTLGCAMSKDKSTKKNTSLRLESKTLKALKIRAIEEDTSVQAILEQLVNGYLNNTIKLKN